MPTESRNNKRALQNFQAVLFISLCVLLSFTNNILAQEISSYIVIDQFGYLPGSKKIAVIRDPHTGFDAVGSFTPGTSYALVNAATEENIFTGPPVKWNNGEEDTTSGDCAWWFDFSSCADEGEYYILDIDQSLRSYNFLIYDSVYNQVLKQAVRTFFYQRAGFEKAEQYAGEGWADGASHLGPLQDKNCRLFSAPGDESTEKDLHGGWYDAGDYNKYTNWTANYVVEMMKAFLENPTVWGDDYNIPESGNQTPDLLDEAKWGIDYLLRLQQDDGSVLCIVDLAHASPPSEATGPSLYGPATTSATFNTAAALALSSKVFHGIDQKAYADILKQKAIKAWNWADQHPGVFFRNNDPAYGSQNIGAGQQESVDDYSQLMFKLEAACFLFDLTGENTYRDFFDDHYDKVHMMQWTYVYPFETTNQYLLLHYTKLPGATASVVEEIRSAYRTAMNNGSHNFTAYYNDWDPYQAHIKDYTWGSNSTKSCKGNMFRDYIFFGIDVTKEEDADEAALNYLHYLHGVNPLNLVYLSNMYSFGGDSCVNEFYHSWFTNGSPLWDRVGVSTYGPPPGYLTGGPNPSYDWDGCCPEYCGSDYNNALCYAESISPPKDQPRQKSYKDFNTSWPLNSWEVTENSCGYQVNYIRLLSKYVSMQYDCMGELNGTAAWDVCGVCAGGNTGIEPETDPGNCVVPVAAKYHTGEQLFTLFPNPATQCIEIVTEFTGEYRVKISDITGVERITRVGFGNTLVNTSWLIPGNYLVIITAGDNIITRHLRVE